MTVRNLKTTCLIIKKFKNGQVHLIKAYETLCRIVIKNYVIKGLMICVKKLTHFVVTAWPLFSDL